MPNSAGISVKVPIESSVINVNALKLNVVSGSGSQNLSVNVLESPSTNVISEY